MTYGTSQTRSFSSYTVSDGESTNHPPWTSGVGGPLPRPSLSFRVTGMDRPETYPYPYLPTPDLPRVTDDPHLFTCGSLQPCRRQEGRHSYGRKTIPTDGSTLDDDTGRPGPGTCRSDDDHTRPSPKRGLLDGSRRTDSSSDLSDTPRTCDTPFVSGLPHHTHTSCGRPEVAGRLTQEGGNYSKTKKI